MELKYFMEGIQLPIDGRKYVCNYKMQKDDYKKWKSMFYKDTAEFLSRIDNIERSEELVLFLYIKFAVELYENYRIQNIPEKIYFDTFSDFTIWYNHCLKDKNKPGLTEASWLTRHLKMKLFRLGRLQYEKGENILHVHIPEGMPLDLGLCDISFAMANDFFSREYETYDCQSWLLDPALQDILDKESNIIKFQKRFKILNVKKSQQAEERVFGRIVTKVDEYPDKTSLQRKMKKYLLSGKKIGEGYGVISRSKTDGGENK